MTRIGRVEGLLFIVNQVPNRLGESTETFGHAGRDRFQERIVEGGWAGERSDKHL
ncbi:hypothetical protein MLIT_33260 [Mycolicibacterium litorale]|uniref:Uncharacterized protein n=1 Tax=Mycolicibacterium litorale TaxID=758802 RepID=A0AAD1IM95_9MYCO|nr:hypothetical protein MLIT_33260 [Mycolicibacterium litorale]